MPRGKMVTPLFGICAISLSLYFANNENKALAAERPYIVVLDPGHGGSDRGTSALWGKKRIAEKDIALAVALRAAQFLNDPAYNRPLGRKLKVVLTRDRDRYVSLEKRSARARKLKADLFVSIHANSESTHSAQGIESYFLNNTDNKASLKLQQIENKSSPRARKKTGSDSLLLRTVAADAVVESSRTAAEILQSSIADQLRVEDAPVTDRGVKQAMFYVLLDSQVPATLVELFYVSNPRDLAFFAQPENRQKVAEGLAKGILRFLATR